ncbi:fructose-bisphosphatase class II [Agromyces soli]|uniref:Fructose-1,6-bisphosphatase class 2 n=1 Tax=Agromyces soli TaxID=659012 RepID=A0ABY4ASS6_9MICO|nr:fructose-bisphosphatase class II [Agromyces soli]UOE24918.1 fructose-bisphosphatase class II family protein [Agromyces soli]
MIVSLDVADLTDPLVAAVVAAAAGCLPLVGGGDGDALDGAAVAAMRGALASAPVEGRVVVGEGEKDEAPMLSPGERFGRGGVAVDLAVDPVDGTRLAAAGRPGAMAVAAATARDGFLHIGPAHYLDKLVTWVPGLGAADAPAGELLAAVPALVARAAELRGVPAAEVRIAVQERPRNRGHAEAVRASGAELVAFEHGEVERSLRALHGGARDGSVRAGALAAADAGPFGEGPLDAVLGIGGAPEGVIVAGAARALGGSMLARFAPQSRREAERIRSALGADVVDPRRVISLELLCAGPAEVVVAAVTPCEIGVELPGAEDRAGGVRVAWWSAASGRHGRMDLPGG